MNHMNSSTQLPKIVRFFEPTYAPDSQCPHCGANGALIHRFQTEDGRALGAMSGCIKLFPVSPVAAIDVELRKKEARALTERRAVASWDVEKRTAIDAFYAGSIDERLALNMIAAATAQANTWRKRRFR